MTDFSLQFVRTLFWLGCLLGCVFNRTIEAQTFIVPEIPAGRSIGQFDSPRLRPLRTGGATSENPLIFGPVDGAVPTLTGSGGRVGVDDPFSGASERLNNAANAVSGTGVPAPVPLKSLRSLQFLAPTATDGSQTSVRETAARRPKADVSPMADREIVRQRYDDGNVQIARHVKLDEDGNFVNDGQWKLFDRSGVTIAAGTYANGEMEGPWARLHSQGSNGIFVNPPFSQFQGPFTSKTTFSQGRIAGVWTITDAEGRKVFEMPYRDGKRHGLAVWFFPGDRVYRRMQFSNNVPDGQLTQFDERGNVTRKEIYQDGKRIINKVTYYRPTNQKRVATIVHKGRLELEGADDWWEAQPAEMVVTGADVQQGPIHSWYQNGQSKMVGNLDGGVRVGRFVWWHENGSKQSMGNYDKSGKKIGQWVWWHDNGIKSIVGQYEHDQPAGLWRWWDRDGKQLNEETFDPDATEPRQSGLGGQRGVTSVLSRQGNPDDANGIDFGKDAVNRSDGASSGNDGNESIKIEFPEEDDPADLQRGADQLEDITPQEIELEELPEPSTESLEAEGDAANDSPKLFGPMDEDQFFQTSF